MKSNLTVDINEIGTDIYKVLEFQEALNTNGYPKGFRENDKLYFDTITKDVVLVNTHGEMAMLTHHPDCGDIIEQYYDTKHGTHGFMKDLLELYQHHMLHGVDEIKTVEQIAKILLVPVAQITPKSQDVLYQLTEDIGQAPCQAITPYSNFIRMPEFTMDSNNEAEDIGVMVQNLELLPRIIKDELGSYREKLPDESLLDVIEYAKNRGYERICFLYDYEHSQFIRDLPIYQH